MKSGLWLTGCAAAVLLTAGCGPDLAQGGYGAEEQQWQKAISDSYSGYRPPRIAPPAIVDKASPEALEKQREQREQQDQAGAAQKTGDDSVSEVPAPAEDGDRSGKTGVTPAQAVDSAAEKAPAAGADDKKADAEKADDKKADAKKADAKKPDAKKADDKKAGAKADPADLDGEIYVVRSGDNLGSIAKKFYGKASLHELILKANPQIKDPKQIPIGTKLRIPKL